MSQKSQAQAEIRAIRALARAEGRPLRQEEQGRISELRAELDQLKNEEKQ